MSILPEYLKSRGKIILVITAVIAVFCASNVLFDMPMITMVYPLILSLIILTASGAVDYVLFAGRHAKLTDGVIPEASGTIEKDYQKVIKLLQEEALENSRKADEDYHDMIEYYTVWAHQIKTPIASMRLALQNEDSEASRKLSGDLNRIESYVEMVLTYLRLDSDSTDYLIKTYSLDDIIRSAVKKYSREFILKKLKLIYEPVDFRVITDEKWLSFIIEQVISNAVKYTSEGEVRIYMNEPGLLKIGDTGIGIAAEDLPRIFENGYTGFNGREDKRASGIGLYLCKRIADNLGHGIKADSVPGEGTTITIDLRRRELEVG